MARCKFQQEMPGAQEITKACMCPYNQMFACQYTIYPKHCPFYKPRPLWTVR